MTPLFDLESVAAIIREIGETIVLPYFRALDPSQVREKTGPTDIVTIADEAAETALATRLADLLPGSLVVGEEATSADPSLFSRISGDVPVWIVDPVDGTLNFASGNPSFGMIVALVGNGRTLAGWIHDPCGRRMAVGALGGGVLIDGRKAALCAPPVLGDMTGVVSRRYCSDATRTMVEERSKTFRDAPPSQCSAQEYLRILTGQAQFGLYHRVLPWDHAAGSLLLAEAGGQSAFSEDGEFYAPTRRHGPLLVASDRKTWNKVHAHFFADGLEHQRC